MHLFIAFSLCAFVESSEHDDLVWRDPKHCGINSAYVLLRLKGIDVTYSYVIDELGPAGNGTKITKLRDFLNEFNLGLDVVRMKPDGLRNLQLPVVVFMEPDPSQTDAVGHFNVLVSVDDSKVHFIDGTTGAVWDQDWAVFRKRWSGILLTAEKRSHVPYIAFFLFGAAFFVWRFFLYSRRKLGSVGLVLFGMFFCSTPSRADELSVSKTDIIRSISRRNEQLEKGYVQFRKSRIDGDSRHPIYDVEFVFDGDRRYLKHIDLNPDGSGSMERSFDGEFYRSRQMGAYQIHNVESAQAFETIRFDTLFLEFAGIYVSDPTLSKKFTGRRIASTIKSTLESNTFDVNIDDDTVVLAQSNDSDRGGTRQVFVFDRGPRHSLQKRTVFLADEKISEFIYSDFCEVHGTNAIVPRTIEFRSYNDSVEDDAFELTLKGFDWRVPEMKYDINPEVGAILIDYRHITRANKTDAEPVVFFAGANEASLEQTISLAKATIEKNSQIVKTRNEPRGNSYVLAWVVLVVVVAVGFGIKRGSNR